MNLPRVHALLGALLAPVLLAPALAPSSVAAPAASHAAAQTDAQTGAQVAAAANTAPVRIGTYNININIGPAPFAAAVTAMKQQADVFGLQEVSTKAKFDILGGDPLWGYFHPSGTEQNPVMYRRDLFDLVSTRDDAAVTLSPRQRVERPHGTSGSEVRNANNATVVRLRHRASGQVISVVNVHLEHGVIDNGRPLKGVPKRLARYKSQVRALTALAASEEAVFPGRTYVTGDFNASYKSDANVRHKGLPFRRFKAIGFSSIWKGQNLKKGTKGVALLDGVWQTSQASSTRILRSMKWSDHWPAVATFDLALDPAWTSPVGSYAMATPAVSATECNAWFQTRSRPIRLEVSASAAAGFVRAIPVGGTATPGEDFFIDQAGLADGDPSTNYVHIYVLGDKAAEPDETLQVGLASVANATVDASVSTVTLLNDDPGEPPMSCRNK